MGRRCSTHGKDGRGIYTPLTSTHETNHAQNDETNGSVGFLHQHPVVTVDVLLAIGTAVILSVSSLDEHFSGTTLSVSPQRYQSVYYCVTRYFLVRIRTDKCFATSSRLLRCEVVFQNKHTVCSWIHYVCICTAFAQMAWAAAYQ
jgi:hypothetical protein